MAPVGTPAERRDEFAADRDVAAEHRDLASDDRDAVADLRDTEAGDRDGQAARQDAVLADRLEDIRGQIFERLARTVSVDEADWPNLTPTDLARLREYAAEQHRLAASDRAALNALFDGIRAILRRSNTDRRDAATDRLASARDRVASHADRRDAAQDRDDADRDRNQAAIESQLADAPEDVGGSRPDPAHADESLRGRVTRAVAESAQRIADTKDYLASVRNRTS